MFRDGARMQKLPDFTQPLAAPLSHVTEEFVDPNGHMNVGFYSVVFDRALDKVMTPLGMDWSMIERANTSFFVVEAHLSYLQELLLGAPLRITFQLLDFDAKRIHFVLQMYHAEEGYLAAVSEQTMLHVDLGARRSAPLLPEYHRIFEAMMAAHQSLPRPPQVGRSVGLRKPQVAAVTPQ